MLEIEFSYADKLSNWEWRKQKCTVSSVEECKRIYGLDDNREEVQWMITSIKECEE